MMSNMRQARPLNRGSGQRQRTKEFWGRSRAMFAGSGMTSSQQSSFLARVRALQKHQKEIQEAPRSAGTTVIRTGGDRL
jgi:hypothetical protein